MSNKKNNPSTTPSGSSDFFIPALEDRPSVAVDTIIFTVEGKDLKVLLIKRKIEPFKGMWAIPGGFVRMGETLDQAARRELYEETNVSTTYLEQLYTFGDPGRDPRAWVVTIAYFALISSEKLEIKADTDAEEVDWFSMYNLPPLAFDHDKILKYALERLRNKLSYTTIGFQLLPKKFTLTELQKVYEIILSKPIDKRNFRKKILSENMLIELEETKMDGVHRPARLYQFKENQ